MTTPTEAPNATAAPAGRAQRRPPVIGVSDDMLDSVDSVSTDAADVSYGAEMDYTILGIETDEGGYMVTEDADGKPIANPFEARPQMFLHYRIDSAEFDYSENPNGFERINIPKAVLDPNTGKMKRGKPREGSQQQLFLSLLEQRGITGNPDLATAVHMTSFRDLTGIKVHREMVQFQNPMLQRDPNARPIRVPEWTTVYGFDNEVRKQAKLPPMVQGEGGRWELAKK